MITTVLDIEVISRVEARNLLQVVDDGVAGVVVLARGMGEQLHRLDVGVAVDDAPGQHRARLRDIDRAPADARHEVDRASTTKPTIHIASGTISTGSSSAKRMSELTA